MKNMQNLFKQAQKLQEKINTAQKELDVVEVIGSSGAGLVSVTMNCKYSVKSIKIDESIINPAESEIMEDLIIAAFNDAKDKATIEAEEKMKEASGGIDVPNLQGLF
jgi:DNA-binding YbaB/EbfC family protein